MENVSLRPIVEGPIQEWEYDWSNYEPYIHEKETENMNEVYIGRLMGFIIWL